MPKNVITIPATMNEFTATPIYTKEKRKVAGYARVSTDREEQQTSYEAQVNYYTDFIQSHDDWEFAGIYTDEGISATSMKHRSGFLSMIDDAMAGKIDLIVTKSVSRFARNTVDSLATIRKLKENPEVTEIVALPGNAGIAQDAGYKGAFTIKYGVVDRGSNFFALERVPIFNTAQNTMKNFYERIAWRQSFEEFGWTKK